MMMTKLCLALLLGAAFALADNQCTIAFNQLGEPMPCMALQDGQPIEVSKEECANQPTCCAQDDGCFVRAKESGGVGALEKENDLLNDFLSETDGPVKAAQVKQKEVMSRHLSFGPLGPPGCLPPAPFPAKCKFVRNEPYVLDPPVDVPYCVRIPCSADNNGPLEKSHKLCGSQPGCYFDKALYEYREAFGDAVLPGVPVCQLAIRSKVFHEKAQKVVSNYGSWNPYFTNCLLKEYDEEIRAGPKGCNLLPILDVFFIKPKLAGWSTITTRECALIDGCFRPGYGCFYPVDISNVVVKSGQRHIGFNKNEINYGRPKCQHFDQSSPVNILKSYHVCLASGCSVDPSVTALYNNHLFSVGEGLTVKNHWEFWSNVQKGHVGAFNIEEMLQEYGYSAKNVIPILPTPSSTDSPFAMPGGSGPAKPYAFSSGPSAPSFSMPSFTTLPSKGKSHACGYAFKQYNARPCAPQTLPLPKRNSYCPYKPFFVPRFPQLTGKFDGCCEVNLCYLPRSEISRMHSGPSFYYSEWSEFSACSTTCGAGERRRYRKCVSHDKSKCTEPLVQVRSCREAPCASWSQWSPYSLCPHTCFPGGIQSRTRVCLPSSGHCEGESEQVRSCNQHACGSDTPKGTWTQWYVEGCTYDRSTDMCAETRTRFCTYEGVPGGKCIGSNLDSKKYSCGGCPGQIQG